MCDAKSHLRLCLPDVLFPSDGSFSANNSSNMDRVRIYPLYIPPLLCTVRSNSDKCSGNFYVPSYLTIGHQVFKLFKF